MGSNGGVAALPRPHTWPWAGGCCRSRRLHSGAAVIVGLTRDRTGEGTGDIARQLFEPLRGQAPLFGGLFEALARLARGLLDPFPGLSGGFPQGFSGAAECA